MDGTEDNPGSLNPFNLQLFDDDAPNGLFELFFSLSFLTLLTPLVFCYLTIFLACISFPFPVPESYTLITESKFQVCQISLILYCYDY